MVVRTDDVSLAKLTHKLTFSAKKTRKQICAVVTLSGDRVLFPRYADPGFRIGTVSIDEPDDFGAPGEYLTWNPDRQLNDKQLPGVLDVCSTLMTHFGCTMNGETGSGKTVMALATVHRLQPRRTLVLVDRIDLARQWADRIAEYLPGTAVRFLMSEKDVAAARAAPETSKGRIIIATGQSLYQSQRFTADNPISCDMLICDEAHVFSAPTFLKSVLRLRFRYSLALTATIGRKDGLEKLFLSALGKKIVRVSGHTMIPKLIGIRSPNAGINEVDWQMFWCSSVRGMTWIRKCTGCPQFAAFPNCAGAPNLPDNSTESARRKIKLNRSGLVAAWSTSPEIVAWARDVILFLAERRRQMFVFADGRKVLEMLHVLLTEKLGEDRVGLFLGGAGTSRKITEQRTKELHKQVTLATFRIADKGLDVVEKDTAFFITPIADGTQAAGRVRRVKDGKAEPIVLAAVPDIPTLERTWERLERQARKNQWTVKLISKLT